MKSISVQYQELKEGKMNKHQFLRNARMMFPNFVTNHNSFDDSVKILKNKGLLNEGDAVKGTPDKAPSYDYPTQPAKYKKVVQEPEVDEQDGIYPATTVTDIPKEEVSKPIKSKNRPDGLEPIKPHDTKNEMKKIRIVKESKKNLTENTVTAKQIQDKYNEMFGKNPQTTFADVAKALGVSEQEIAFALFAPDIAKNLKEVSNTSIKSAAQKGMSTGDYSELDTLVFGKASNINEKAETSDVAALLNLINSNSTLKNKISNINTPAEFRDFLDDLINVMSSDLLKNRAGLRSAAQKAIEDVTGTKKDFSTPMPSKPRTMVPFTSTLKDRIKEMIQGILNEYEEGDESDEAPSVLGVIDMIVKDMVNAIESNDLNLEFKAKDVEDELNYFQDKIGYRYSDEQFQDIVDGAVAELKKQGYNIK